MTLDFVRRILFKDMISLPPTITFRVVGNKPKVQMYDEKPSSFTSIMGMHVGEIIRPGFAGSGHY